MGSIKATIKKVTKQNAKREKQLRAMWAMETEDDEPPPKSTTTSLGPTPVPDGHTQGGAPGKQETQIGTGVVRTADLAGISAPARTGQGDPTHAGAPTPLDRGRRCVANNSAQIRSSSCPPNRGTRRSTLLAAAHAAAGTPSPGMDTNHQQQNGRGGEQGAHHSRT